MTDKGKTRILDSEGKTRQERTASSLREELQPGFVLNGRYEIIEQIGAGSAGSVYLCFDRKLEIQKALKILGHSSDAIPLAAEVRREARLLAKLSHENILQVFDFDDSGDYLFLDTEYIEGNDLSKARISRSKVPYIALQLATALDFAHKENVLHLDIKPSNILLSKKGRIKVSDFGIANLMREATKETDRSGTLLYMPPEKLDSGETSRQTDIYSFGLTLYEILYHSYPLETNSDGNPVHLIPSHLINSRRPLDLIIRKCLSINPVGRYNSFGEIRAELEKIYEWQNRPIHKKIFYVVYRLNPVNNLPIELRKDINLLILLLTLISLMTPFYFRIAQMLDKSERQVQLNGPPYQLLVNDAFRGTLPGSFKLRPGDRMQFIDSTADHERINNFFLIYDGKDAFNLETDTTSIRLNGTVIGRQIRSRNELPLEENLRFLSLAIALNADNLRTQQHPELYLFLSRDAPLTALANLPYNLKYLNISRNKNIHNLRGIRHFRNLKGLDASGIPNLDLKGIENLRDLRNLNISRSDITSLQRLQTLSQLRNLNIYGNQLRELAGLENARHLQSLKLNSNIYLTDISAIKNLPRLRIVERTRVPFIKSEQVRDLSKQLSKTRTQPVERVIYRKIPFPHLLIMVLAAVLLLFAIIMLIRIFFIRLPEIKQTKPTKKAGDDQTEPSVDELKAIKKIAAAGRLYSPEDDNALVALKALKRKYRGNKDFAALEKELIRKIREIIANHKQHREFEPAYNAALKSNRIIAKSVLRKEQLKLLPKLVKIKPIKMVLIEGGTFAMGDFELMTRSTALPVHDVTLDSFEISNTVVTNRQYCEFLNYFGRHSEGLNEWLKLSSPYCMIEKGNRGYKPTHPHDSFPVIEVSWFGALRFCQWFGGRLPTEAEWEYVARSGGKDTVYAFSGNPDPKRAQYLANPNNKRWHSVVSVSTFKPNKLG
ncbi:MAG: SUMF1/EgtB/PvdO family nonheme iron enzyme, partial [Candidatus Cloacimonetes bacterium]|nr:SUMF1/EgtB/PvdO family nonheme iron enzyme [Candidatus Cloacimonadota bacterium]